MLALQCGGVLSDIDAACRALKPIAGGPEARLSSVAAEFGKALQKCRSNRGDGFQRGFRAQCRLEVSPRCSLRADERANHVRVRRRAGGRLYPCPRPRAQEHRVVRRSGRAGRSADRGELASGIIVQGQGRRTPAMPDLFQWFRRLERISVLFGIGPELSARGISVLFIDHPGVGEACACADFTPSPKPNARRRPASTICKRAETSIPTASA